MVCGVVTACANLLILCVFRLAFSGLEKLSARPRFFCLLSSFVDQFAVLHTLCLCFRGPAVQHILQTIHVFSFFSEFCALFLLFLYVGRGAGPAVESPLSGDKAQQDSRRRENDPARRPDLARQGRRRASSTPRLVSAPFERGEGVPFHGRRHAGRYGVRHGLL